MTNAQKLALQLSVAAGRLNEIGLLTGDAYSEEIRSEETKLQTESRETRTRYESALIAEGDDAHKAGSQFGAGDSTEDRAYRELTGRANVGRMIIGHQWSIARLTARTLEILQKHLGLAPNQIPLDLLRAPAEEHRARHAFCSQTSARRSNP